MAYPNFQQNGYYQPSYGAPNGAMMDSLNQYKVPYYPMQQPHPTMQQPQMPPVAQQPPVQSQNDMIWVLGEVEATSYPVAPNNTVILWDKNQPTIYIKSVNAQGVPSMRVLDFTERAQNAPKMSDNHVCQCGKDFVKLEDFKALEAKFEALTGKFEALSKPKAKAKEAKEDITNE